MGAKVNEAPGESLQDVTLCSHELRTDRILNVHIQTTLSSNVESVANTTLDLVAEGISHQVVQPTTANYYTPILWPSVPSINARKRLWPLLLCDTNFSKSKSHDARLAADNPARKGVICIEFRLHAI